MAQINESGNLLLQKALGAGVEGVDVAFCVMIVRVVAVAIVGFVVVVVV